MKLQAHALSAGNGLSMTSFYGARHQRHPRSHREDATPHLGPSLEQPVPLSDLLAIRLERSPNEAALLSLEGNASWSELDRMASRLAASYVALGLKPGDRFASLMPNRIALIAHYLACFKAGLVATPLNYRYMAPEIDHAFQVSGASVLADPRRAPR
jgi:long-chain acyl-CoA synthetase